METPEETARIRREEALYWNVILDTLVEKGVLSLGDADLVRPEKWNFLRVLANALNAELVNMRKEEERQRLAKMEQDQVDFWCSSRPTTEEEKAACEIKQGMPLEEWFRADTNDTDTELPHNVILVCNSNDKEQTPECINKMMSQWNAAKEKYDLCSFVEGGQFCRIYFREVDVANLTVSEYITLMNHVNKNEKNARCAVRFPFAIVQTRDNGQLVCEVDTYATILHYLDKDMNKLYSNSR